MHQGRQIAIALGFNPEKDKHFLCCVKSKVIKLQAEIVTLAYERTIEADARAQALTEFYNELSNILLNLSGKNGWYCFNCGPLDANEVTFDEHCAICGYSV